MKKQLTLTLLSLLLCVGVMGQTKPEFGVYKNGQLDTAMTTRLNYDTGKLLIAQPAINFQPLHFSVFNQNKEWLKIEGKPTWNNPDSLIIYLHKSQLRWINDSTAVIKKPTQ